MNVSQNDVLLIHLVFQKNVCFIEILCLNSCGLRGTSGVAQIISSRRKKLIYKMLIYKVY